MEEKFCKVCGKKIENPRANAKTCCDPECTRKYNIMSTREGQIKREKNPEYLEERRKRSNQYYHHKIGKLNELERQLLGYKVNELADKLKDTYFAGGCGGENLDKLLEVMKGVILDPYSIDDAIESLDDVETL